MQQIYLDYNATTPVAPQVRDAMLPFLGEHFGNPSSSHALGRAAHAAVEQARAQVAELLEADPEEIVFTGGGTESNNLAILGLLLREAPPVTGHLVISALEHPATTAPAAYLQRWGCQVTVVPCDSQGLVDPQRVADALRSDTRLVSVMHANNEIGTVQPLREITEVCRRRGIPVHTDAAQSIGKLHTSVAELGVDLLSIAGHKFYAPKGIGALYIRRGGRIDPVLHGAGHERGLRPGTENTPHIVGLGRAAALVRSALGDAAAGMTACRDLLETRLRAAIPGLTCNGQGAPRLPNTSSVNFPRAVGSELLRAIPELCASTGSACHSGTTIRSATLAAIGVPPDVARGTIRLSAGWFTTENEVERAAELLIDAWERMM
jgi:cysteine desulfurase